MARSRMIFTTVALAAAALLSASAASASAPSAAPTGQATSPSEAGYVVTGSGAHHVSATWIQPRATCGSGKTYADVGIGLSSSTSPRYIRLTTGTDCKGGQPTYSAFVTLRPRARGNLGEHVEPGDRLTAEIDVERAHVMIWFSDRTQGWGVATVPTFTRVRYDAAQIGIRARVGSSGVLPLTDFGSARFLRPQVDGQPLAQAHRTRLTMTGAGGQVKAAAGSVDSSGGFSVSWRRH